MTNFALCGKLAHMPRGQESLLKLPSDCAMFTLALAHSLFEISTRCAPSLAMNSATGAHSRCTSVAPLRASDARVSISRQVSKTQEGDFGHLCKYPPKTLYVMEADVTRRERAEDKTTRVFATPLLQTLQLQGERGFCRPAALVLSTKIVFDGTGDKTRECFRRD